MRSRFICAAIRSASSQRRQKISSTSNSKNGRKCGPQKKFSSTNMQENKIFRGVFGHHYEPVPWVTGDECCVSGVAKIVGAHEDEIALMNGLTVNLHILLTAFYKPKGRRHKIVIEDHAFPSDHYAVESQIRLNGYDPTSALLLLKPREVSSAKRSIKKCLS